MINHNEFSALRLADFCTDDPEYADYEDEHGDLLVEGIRGINFFRHAHADSGTLIIEIDMLDHSTDAGPAILSRAGLPVTRESSLSDVVGLLGQPESSNISPDRGYDYFRTDSYVFTIPGDDGYEIHLVWIHPGNVGRLPPLRVKQLSLWSVRIARSDLSSYPWSDD